MPTQRRSDVSARRAAGFLQIPNIERCISNIPQPKLSARAAARGVTT
jgi:hypothetical protein